jgi:hypothetical protein
MLLNKCYIVYLDNENKFSFTSKREANYFINEFYRLYYLADKDFEFKYNISNSIDFINNRLIWVSSHEGSQNHDTILFHSIINCIDELLTAFSLMQKKAVSRNDAITRRRCCLRSNVIGIYKDNILRIGIKPKEVQLQIRKAR